MLWTLLTPLLNTAILTIALSQLMRFEVTNYPIYLLVGYLVWTLFTQTTTQAMNNLIWGSNLIHRIYIPRTIVCDPPLHRVLQISKLVVMLVIGKGPLVL